MARTAISVTPEQLKTVAGKVGASNQTYEKQYKRILTEVENLSARWKGQGNQDFVERIRSFQDQFLKLKNVLDDYVIFLNKASEIYANTERSIKDGTRKLAR